MKLDFNRPGTPGDNALKEVFIGTLRRECLSQQYLLSLEEAQQVPENWKVEYNNDIYHDSLDKITPALFCAR